MREKDLGAQSATAVERAGSIDASTATARHTPGPWSVSVDDSNEQPYIIDADGRLVAKALHECVKPRQELDATAHLIAAAPELLEACRQLTEFAKRQGWFHVAIEAGEAAIRKAEGR